MGGGTGGRGGRSGSDEPARLVDACLMPGFTGAAPPGWLLDDLAGGLAGVCVYGHNLVGPGPRPATARVRSIADGVRGAAPDALIALDEEGGDVTRLEYTTGSSYPGNLALGVVDDPRLTAAVATAIAADLRRAGVTVTFAPSVDVNSDPRNPVIGVRSFGPDPARVAVHGAAFVTAVQRAGVAATAKHFPGHGATATDSHLALPRIDVDEATFRRRELPPFAAAVDAGVALVMTAHVVVGALDPLPATLSRRLLVDVLRGELGFEGVVVTDALDMAGVRAGRGLAGAGVAALAAGADLLLIGAEDGEEHCAALRRAVAVALRDGTLAEERLVEAAGRVGRLRARLAAGAIGPGEPGEPGDPSGPADPGIGAEAARRAVRTRGGPVLAGPATVVELRGGTNLAVGEAHWSLAEPLAALGAVVGDAVVGDAVVGGGDGVVTVTDGAPTVAEVLAGLAPGAVVVAVRDARRSPWQRAWLAGLLAARPDAVLVALGMPEDAELTTGPVVLTVGAGRANTAAAAALLAGRG